MTKLKILIAEDKEEWQKTLCAILENTNLSLDIDQAYTAKQVEEFIDANTYDLVIFDIGLPLDDKALLKGEDQICLYLLSKIRADKNNHLCGIIVLTGYGQISDAITSVQEYKVYVYVEKDNFPTYHFPKTVCAAIFQSRLWRIEEVVNNRYQLTIHLNKDSVIGCEVVHGTNILASHMLDRPKIFDCDEFARRGDNLNIFLSTIEGIQRWRPEAKAIGKEIYEQIFSERAFGENLYKAQSNAKSTNDLWIRLNGSANTLAVPFELMHNNLDYLSHQHIFTRSLTGYNIPHKKTFHLFLKDLEKSNETLRILIAGSNCDGKIPQVDAEIEILKDEITDSLNHLGIKFKVEPLFTEEASYEKVSEFLRSGNYHIFHFCGHGDFVSQVPENSGIWLLDKSGMPKKLGAAQLNLLTQNSALQFAFLNCCLSAGTADRIGGGDFYGIFEALVRAGVPSALGYRWTVLDKSALQLARKFYHKLWRSFSPGESLYYARQEIKFEQGLNDETWASPVLLMQNS